MTNNSKTILIVEDEKFYFKPLETKLKSAGFKVFLAKNGKEGLKILEKNQVDILLLDVIMPVMGGLVMLTELRKNKELSTLPIVMLSILDMPSHEKVVTDDNYCIYLKKPLISPEKIIEFLNLIFKNQDSTTPPTAIDKKILTKYKEQLHLV